MQRAPVTDAQRHRIEASLPFVEGLARRMAASMPNSIDLGDLVQSGMIGLIDAAPEAPVVPRSPSDPLQPMPATTMARLIRERRRALSA